MVDVMEANEFRDVRHGFVGVFEKFFGLGNAQIDQIFVGRRSHVSFELFCHVIFANVELFCQVIE